MSKSFYLNINIIFLPEISEVWVYNYFYRVICRQLGYTSYATPHSYAAFGQGSVPILLDNLACTGSETSIDQCGHNGVGNHNCVHSEDAGVSCG